MVFKWVFGFLLGVSSPRFQNNFSARLFWRHFLVMIAKFDSVILHVLLQRIFWYDEYWFGVGSSIGPKEKLFTLLLVCKSWFEMVYDACMIMYIVYIWYSILWVFALFVSDFDCLIHILSDCLIHILGVNFKIWARQPTKR